MWTPEVGCSQQQEEQRQRSRGNRVPESLGEARAAQVKDEAIVNEVTWWRIPGSAGVGPERLTWH